MVVVVTVWECWFDDGVATMASRSCSLEVVLGQNSSQSLRPMVLRARATVDGCSRLIPSALLSRSAGIGHAGTALQRIVLRVKARSPNRKPYLVANGNPDTQPRAPSSITPSRNTSAYLRSHAGQITLRCPPWGAEMEPRTLQPAGIEGFQARMAGQKKKWDESFEVGGDQQARRMTCVGAGNQGIGAGVRGEIVYKGVRSAHVHS